MSINNGRRTARTLFAVALSPKRDGVVTIPPITVDGEASEPLVLTIKPSALNQGAQGDVFLERDVSESNPYVQQQVLVTLKLFSVVQVQRGSLDLDIPDGIRAVRLGDDSAYRANRGGKDYFVIERRFALVPERSGRFELGSARFEGLGVGRAGLNSYFGSATRLRASSDPLSLQVKPVPPGAGTPWLPALSLSLSGEPELPQEIRVGEPISYPVTLRADGLSVEQLPELELGAADGLSIYPDQPNSRDRSSLQGLAGERSRRFAIVPSAAGKWQIPALTISWWDVQTDQRRQAELPSRTIDVLPARGSMSRPAEGTTLDSTQQAETLNGEANPFRSLGRPWPWMLLSALLACGWAWTWWRATGGRRSPPSVATESLPDGLAASRSALRRALRDGELPAIAQALRALSPQPARSGLHDLADRLQLPEQARALRRLDQALYGRSLDDADALRRELRQVFAAGPRWRAPTVPPGNANDLPPLYASTVEGLGLNRR